MASIPSNGYAEVMAGTNNYSGSNSYDGSCPRTAIPPVIGNDLCNKTYVDAATGGGIIGTLTDKGSLITGDGTQPVIFDQNPYQTALTTTTVYEWSALAIGQSRNFTTTFPTLIPLGAGITITYSGTDSIKGTITAVAGTTITITITAVASAAYVPTTVYTSTPPAGVLAGSLSPPSFNFTTKPAVSTPNPPIIPANTMITDGISFVHINTTPTNFTVNLISNPAGTTLGSSTPTPASAFPNPNNFQFVNGAFVSTPTLFIVQIANLTQSINFQYPIGGGFAPPDYCGQLNGYSLAYSTGSIVIDDDICLIADATSATGLAWGVINTASIGAVTSVSGGVNIVMSGTIPAPVVNLRNPLTAELNMGSQSLRDSASAVGTSGQLLSAGTGGQTLWTNPPPTNPTITDTNTNATYYPTFVAGSGTQPLLADISTGPISLNPSNGNFNVVDTMKLTQSQLSVGKNAGLTSQGAGSVAIGDSAGKTSQSNAAVAIGQLAGQTSQGSGCVAVGTNAGETSQGNHGVAVGNATGNTNQGVSAVALGNSAGQTSQGANAVAIGLSAGAITQGIDAIAVGIQAGQTTQGTLSIAIGANAGNSSQGQNSVAIGNVAGLTTQGTFSVAVGNGAGRTTQGNNATAVGQAAGFTNQGLQASAFGAGAGQTNQGADAVAVGVNAGLTNQSTQAVAIGGSAGGSSQGAGAVAVGRGAGQTSQGGNAVAVGSSAGNNTQGSKAIAIGVQSGETSQGGDGVAIGNACGRTSQGAGSVAVGVNAGNSGQLVNAVAVGNGAGQTTQGTQSVAIGASAGNTSQGNNSVALGYTTGQTNQGANATALGHNAGNSGQGNQAVAVGHNAGETSQGANAIAIGHNAGEGTTSGQGANAIAIGHNAGQASQTAGSICLNATGSALNPNQAGLFVAPVRNLTGNQNQQLQYDPTTFEVSSFPNNNDIIMEDFTMYDTTPIGPQPVFGNNLSFTKIGATGTVSYYTGVFNASIVAGSRGRKGVIQMASGGSATNTAQLISDLMFSFANITKVTFGIVPHANETLAVVPVAAGNITQYFGISDVTSGTGVQTADTIIWRMTSSGGTPSAWQFVINNVVQYTLTIAPTNMTAKWCRAEINLTYGGGATSTVSGTWYNLTDGTSETTGTYTITAGTGFPAALTTINTCGIAMGCFTNNNTNKYLGVDYVEVQQDLYPVGSGTTDTTGR